MSILIDKSTRLVVQGITGRDGSFHTQQMISYGTRVVAGVTPGRGGERVHGVPVFDSVAEAVATTKANTSVIYVPAPFATDAIYEAADAGVGLIVCITEGVPVRDTLGAYHHVRALRSRAARWACFDRALCDAADFPSRSSASWIARERFADGLRLGGSPWPRA